MYVICVPALKDSRPLLMSYWASWWDTKEDFHHFIPLSEETPLRFPTPEEALNYLRKAPWRPDDIVEVDVTKAWVVPEDVLKTLAPALSK